MCTYMWIYAYVYVCVCIVSCMYKKEKIACGSKSQKTTWGFALAPSLPCSVTSEKDIILCLSSHFCIVNTLILS